MTIKSAVKSIAKKINSKTQYMVIIIFLISIPIIINVDKISLVLMGSVNREAWIGFYGSYIGAIIGGLVAFKVAQYQIKEARENDRKKLEIDQLPTLIRISSEITKLQGEWILLEKSYLGLKELKDGEALRIAIIKDNVLDERNWDGIEKITDVQLQVDLLKVKEFYQNFILILNYDPAAVKKELDLIESEISKLENIKNLPNDEKLRYYNLVSQYGPLKDRYIKRTDAKPFFWEVFVKDNYIDKTLDLTIRIDEKIESIEELI